MDESIYSNLTTETSTVTKWFVMAGLAGALGVAPRTVGEQPSMYSNEEAMEETKSVSALTYAPVEQAQTDQERFQILQQFAARVLENVEDTPPVVNQIVADHFWEI